METVRRLVCASNIDVVVTRSGVGLINMAICASRR